MHRAGLYKQLSELKSMVAEVRDDASAIGPLKEPIAACLEATGASSHLQKHSLDDVVEAIRIS